MEKFKSNVLSERSQNLYNYLLKTGNEWISQKDISLHVPGYKFVENPNGTSDQCQAIWEDVEEINSNVNVSKIVVIKKRHYKIATKEEAIEYKEKLLIRANQKFSRYWKVECKTRTDGKLDLFDQTQGFKEVFLDEQLDEIMGEKHGL